MRLLERGKELMILSSDPSRVSLMKSSKPMKGSKVGDCRHNWEVDQMEPEKKKRQGSSRIGPVHKMEMKMFSLREKPCYEHARILGLRDMWISKSINC